MSTTLTPVPGTATSSKPIKSKITCKSDDYLLFQPGSMERISVYEK